MPTHQAIHGRIVDLRRHINVHLVHGHRPPVRATATRSGSSSETAGSASSRSIPGPCRRGAGTKSA